MKDDLKYKKVMLISVGTGTGVADGIYYSIDDHNPNYVYFIVTQKSKEKTLPILEEKLKNKNPNLVIEIFENEEVNDVQKLHRIYSEYILIILKKGFTKENFTVDFTSGTKAMSSALVSAALSFEVKKLSYVYGDRNSEGKVLSGTERINSLYPSAIFSVKKINKFIILFNHYQFESALKIFENEDIHPDYFKVKDVLINMSKTYSAWDKFNFKDAHNNYKNIILENAKEINLKRKIEMDGKILNSLLEKKLDYSKIYDLLSNAKRRYTEGKYDDGMARLYRLLEMIAQVEFEKTFKCTTDNVLLKEINKEHHEKLKCKYYDSYDKKYKIPLSITFFILSKANNEVGKVFEKNKTSIKQLLRLRNQSILAHGLAPVKQESFKKMLEFIKENFIPLLPKNNIQENFQFPTIKKQF